LDEEDEEDIDFDDDEDFEGILCSLSLIYILFCLESLPIMINACLSVFWQMMKMICLSII